MILIYRLLALGAVALMIPIYHLSALRAVMVVSHWDTSPFGYVLVSYYASERT
jgi:hypothetical protein